MKVSKLKRVKSADYGFCESSYLASGVKYPSLVEFSSAVRSSAS